MDTLSINRPLTVLTYLLIKLLIYWYLIISYFLTCFLTYLFNYLPDRLSSVSTVSVNIFPSAKGNCFSCFSIINYIILVTVCH